MSKESLTVLASGFGYQTAEEDGVSLFTVLQELQGLNLAVCSGQTNGGIAMTVSGITTDDTIIAAWECPVTTPTAANLVNRTASTYISGDNAIKCNEGLASDSLFVVLWFNKEP